MQMQFKQSINGDVQTLQKTFFKNQHVSWLSENSRKIDDFIIYSRLLEGNNNFKGSFL